ncbi:hypothetical protein M409DRAFT_19384 [Zasmidium cellare ATCC 36951]|uniref:Uncharacterized protein n=1 Tax=Zasmidium cellare ATCC 36951 TaxID=1080233 RepID=A0A6A6CU48_ZASCE|nr:uncharacterized protein M409DRAFT_19384 [Zasmidium cellare ATCC 36951]KAF2170565.1 hypothetical protein M409DRAFT_19384 [Zasmidium cellare ATCC 36951]
MMTAKQHREAEAKLTRYGKRFDLKLEDHLPHGVVMTKKGTVAKRQPRYVPLSKGYYQAQCSFRGLNCNGSVEELQQRLKANYDHGRDIQIDRELENVRHALFLHMDAEVSRVQEQCRIEQEKQQWKKMSLQERIWRDATRALKQSLKVEDVLRKSCHVIKPCCRGLQEAANSLGLAYECVDTDPKREAFDRFGNTRCQIVGEKAAVKRTAMQLVEDAARKRREAVAKEKARLAKMEAQKEAVLDQATKMADWDITGSWIVECNGLVEDYYVGKRPELKMEIWRDDFDLDNVRGIEPPTDEENSENSEDGTDEDTDQDMSDWDDEEKSILTGEAARIPRFCADFHFNVTEGTMRIYPPKKNRPAEGPFSVKDNPSFRYRWRGRETGEGEIMVDSDERVERILFGSHGTTFRGTYKCPFIEGVFMIKGTKIRHGNQQEQGTEHSWDDFTEEAWEVARERRWGRWR